MPGAKPKRAARHHRHRRFPIANAAAFALALLWTLFPVSWSRLASAQTAPLTASPGLPGRAVETCIFAPRPNSLWSLAQCCSKALQSNPGCRYYDAADEYTILKDNSPRKPAGYLIIPTIAVTGMEDRRIFLPPVVDFWEYGWQQAQKLLRKPAADTALAINSTRGRTQNQFHIHISCVLPSVARRLASELPKIGSNPATAVRLALGPADHVYRVIKATGLAGADSPFNLVAAMPGARADMGDQSIAVVGSAAPGIFYVLDTRAQGANPGAAEELLDQTCSV